MPVTKENQMNRRTFLKAVPALALLATKAVSLAQDAVAPPAPAAASQGIAASPGPAAARIGASAPSVGDLKPIALLKPQKDGGKSVLAAIAERKTNRDISPKPLPPQMLSNLLWAAWGVNRETGGPGGGGGRTAASASNSQEIDLYVALAEGVYLYEAAGHQLAPVAAGDLRARAGRGRGGAAAKAPVNLFFVADLAKFAKGRPQEPGLKDPDIQKSYYCIDAGLIAQNVYLFAASQGLAAWFHNCDKPGFAKDLSLRPDQHVLYAQTVGYPTQADPPAAA
jgi:nitroreductase